MAYEGEVQEIKSKMGLNMEQGANTSLQASIHQGLFRLTLDVTILCSYNTFQI